MREGAQSGINCQRLFVIIQLLNIQLLQIVREGAMHGIKPPINKTFVQTPARQQQDSGKIPPDPREAP